jgi:peptidoglycan hydrolase CwlO-like protein
MKKLMFTAITMMAFMGSSIASTIEIKNNDFNYDLSEKEEIASDVDCNAVRIYSKLRALGQGASEDVANAVAWSAYYQCLQLTKP